LRYALRQKVDVTVNQSLAELETGRGRLGGSEGEKRLIGLISDTHISSEADELPQRVIDAFKDVSLILHAGDLVYLKVVKDLEKIAPVVAVYGNMDPPEVRARLPEMNSIRILGWNIGVIHDAGALWGKREMRRITKENKFDVLVFGHTHRAYLETKPTVYVNPGSPTKPVPPFITKPSVALLRVAQGGVEPSIVKL